MAMPLLTMDGEKLGRKIGTRSIFEVLKPCVKDFKPWVNNPYWALSPHMEQPDLREIFARNVRVARAAKDISQEALADEAGVDRSYMSRIERGVTWVGLEIIAKLAAVLDVEPYELLLPPPKRSGRPSER